MNKSFTTLLTFLVLFFGAAILLSHYSGASQWLWDVSNQGTWFLPLLVVSAIIDSINPCAFSILIVSLIFLFSLGSTTSKVVKYGLVYVFGIFVAYFLIGLGILQALHIFDIPHFMSKLGALMLVIFGALSILEVLIPSFPIKLGVPHSAHQKMNQLLEKVSIPTMFLLGALVGLCEFPCTGGPYLMVIGLLHDARTYWQGAGYLILYNIIFIVPLVLILFTASSPKLVEKAKQLQQQNKKAMKIGAGIAMILLAILILYI
jgi:cytochrome c-type biogenesis protein